jgi:tRNA pseudouridine55 synthase
VLVDKPAGWTSHDVVAKLRGLFGIKKMGHAGTLDPMATGLIVVGLRRATRLLRFVQAAPKEYIARAVFGVATDSLDADGAVLERSEMDFGEEELRAAMVRFEGRIAQIPPMVSARKVGGKKLYELARAGIEVEREARDVFIHGLELVDFAPSPYPEVVFRTVCSTGTYVRTLADDIARALGGRAHLSALRRLRTGSLHVRDAFQIAELEAAAAAGTIEAKTLSTRDGLADLPEVLAADPIAAGVRNGLAFPVTAFGVGVPPDGPIRIVGESGDLLAVYRVDAGKAAAEVVLG